MLTTALSQGKTNRLNSHGICRYLQLLKQFSSYCHPAFVAEERAGVGPYADDLIWHPSDSRMVTPIVGNAVIERLPQPVWDVALLPFPQLVCPNTLSIPYEVADLHV